MASLVRNGIIYGTSDPATEKQAGLMSPDDKIWVDETSSKQIMTGNTTALTSSDNLDNVLTTGIYYASGSYPSNSPYSNPYILEVIKPTFSTTSVTIQVAFRYGAAGYMAFRNLGSSEWGAWRYILNTPQTNQRVNIQRGYVDYDTGDIAASAVTNTSVTFDTAFGGSPYVFLTWANTGTSSNSRTFYGNAGLSVASQSTTGFTIRILNNSTVEPSCRVNWLAIYC